ncbi:hypothetical protein [Nonomuraea sp. B19D2]|uniref:hypothetical protein n=1 Tax=Nonomuraea sp. B19D2 TaxID=3159561 RepID=UPI0032DBE7D2
MTSTFERSRAGQDPSGLLHLQFLVNVGDHDTFRLHVDLDDLAGKTPAEVLPAMRLLAASAPDTTLLLAVRGGPAYSPRWQCEESPLAQRARRQVRILEALQVIQAHSYQRIVILESSGTSHEELAQIVQLARLLQGPEIEATWTYVDFSIPADAGPPPEGEFSVAVLHELHARLGGRQIPLGMYRCVTYPAARIANPGEAAAAQAGDSIRLLPGSSDRAIITAVSASEARAALAARDGTTPGE